MDVDLTVVVGLDAVTLRQWEVSLPTLRVHRPQLWEKPWLIFFDDNVNAHSILSVLDTNGLEQIDKRLCVWGTDADYPSQRAKMLSGFVHIPAMYVETPWWMKIDTDAIALNSNKWWKDEWFDDGSCCGSNTENAWIASSWSYTKVKGEEATAHDWARRLEEFGDAMFPEFPRLGLEQCVNAAGNKINRKRMCSWVSYYHIDFTLMVADICARHCGADRIPVPSQDTVHWYVAERMGLRRQLRNMKREGWTNCPRFEQLVHVAQNALNHREVVKHG